MPAKKNSKNATDAPAAKKAAKKAPVKTAKKAASKKAATVAKTPAKAAGMPSTSKVTPDKIARSAYLNYRRRVEKGLPGDRESDWLEAERQLSE